MSAVDLNQTAASGLPLHIGYFSPALPDSGASNGIVTYTRIMRDALRALGHRVTVVTADHIEHADGRIGEIAHATGLRGRVNLFRESRFPKDGSSAGARLKVIRAFDAAQDAGVEVFEIEESFGWGARLQGRGIPIVQRLHGPHMFFRNAHDSIEEQRRSDCREAAERHSLEKVQALTSPTQRLIDAVVDEYGLHLEIARAIPNPMPAAPANETWNIASCNPDQILCVGRFDSVKGADVVIAAFIGALKRRPSLKLVMVGPDLGLTEADGARIGFQEFAARELPARVRAAIEFLGPQPPEQIKKLRLASAFSLVGSRFENFPYSIAEALAVGMPVLTTATFGGAKLIRDRLDGRVVPIDDAEAMTLAMLEMVDDPVALSRMGRSAYAEAICMLAPNRIAAETVGLYREVMAKMQTRKDALRIS